MWMVRENIKYVRSDLYVYLFTYMCNHIYMILTRYLSQLFSKNTCDILRYFYKYSEGSFTGRYISKELTMNHKTCLAVLNKLADIEILKKDIIGKSHVFCINKSYYWEHVIDPLIGSEVNLKRCICEEIANKFSKYCSNIIIFGSYSTNEETENSDFDLCFVTHDKDRLELELPEYQKQFYTNYLCHLSPYIITKKDYEDEKLTIVKEIKKYGEYI